ELSGVPGMTDTLALSRVATLPPSALKEHGVAKASVNGISDALCAVQSEYVDTDAIYTHSTASLVEGSLDSERIVSTLHQGTITVKTGEAVDAPCSVAVRTFPVKLQDGVLHVGWEG